MERKELIMLGQMKNSVENLTDHITRLQNSVDAINAQMNKSKGLLVGILLMAGGLGAGITSFFKQ